MISHNIFFLGGGGKEQNYPELWSKIPTLSVPLVFGDDMIFN